MQLYTSWYIRSFFGFTFLNIPYFFKYSCINIFHRRSLYTFYLRVPGLQMKCPRITNWKCGVIIAKKLSYQCLMKTTFDDSILSLTLLLNEHGLRQRKLLSSVKNALHNRCHQRGSFHAHNVSVYQNITHAVLKYLVDSLVCMTR